LKIAIGEYTSGFPKYARQIISLPAENRPVRRDAKIAGCRIRGGNPDLLRRSSLQLQIPACGGHLGIWLHSRLSLCEKRRGFERGSEPTSGNGALLRGEPGAKSLITDELSLGLTLKLRLRLCRATASATVIRLIAEIARDPDNAQGIIRIYHSPGLTIRINIPRV
jgi:hypothetical protein